MDPYGDMMPLNLDFAQDAGEILEPQLNPGGVNIKKMTMQDFPSLRDLETSNDLTKLTSDEIRK